VNATSQREIPSMIPPGSPPRLAVTRDETVRVTVTRHLPEYAMEAAGLGMFMISACLFTALLWHPQSPVSQAVPSLGVRRVLMGAAMGATAFLLITSRWGKRSGAHFNPAVTLTFLRLHKVRPSDAFSYVLAQFAGGALGVMAAAIVLGGALSHEAVRYAVTAPGEPGVAAAFLAEVAITFVLMTVVLHATNSARLMPWTPTLVGFLVAGYIAMESPISGMSMNPARSTASALAAAYFHALWIYFTAPLLGMLAAAELFLRLRRGGRPLCAKLHHANRERCIFRCGYAQPLPATQPQGESK
jgi:aquaporin Z